MFIVLIPKKQIVYLNSMHGVPVMSWIQRICSLLDYTYGTEHNWAEWRVYSPTDIPQQGGVVGSSGNCGLHMCVWYYITYNSKNISFSEEEMNLVCKWIFKLSTTTEHFYNRRLNFVNKRTKPKSYSPLPSN